MNDLKEFLQRDDIQELLAREELEEVYWKYAKEAYSRLETSKLTEFFFNNNINPLQYMTQVLPSMFTFASITSVEVPDNVTEICKYGFTNCEELTNIYLPDSIKSIGEKAFAFCEKLVRITIPEDVPEIFPNTFDYCTSLQTVTVVGQYTKLPADTFFTSHNYTLRCYEHSAAHIFAEDHRINYELIK